MSWPLISDFSRLLQNPKVAFRDPALRECTIELDNLGQPKPRSGNFATVYRGFRPDGRSFAIKVFNRFADERHERYQAISRYLQDHQVSCLVNFEYQEKGIRAASDNKFYPLMMMDWVPGVTLFEWARDRCREGYQEALAIGADVWLQLVRELAAHHVVHGDLQHGNVMVTSDGYFKLVDYDGMAVPELLGRRNLETGLIPYQHPRRDANTLLFPGIDNFSALVIYVALRALAANPRLWSTYVDVPGYDRLLFRKEDFENPNGSYLYHELMHSPEEQVRDLTHYLFQLASYDLRDIPPIDEVLLWCNSLDNLLAAKDFDMAIQLVERMGPGEQIPPHLQPHVAQAYQRVACRKALEEALLKGDEDEIQRRYLPELLDDYPAASPLVEQARQAAQVKEALQVLSAALRFKSWAKLKSTWLANQDVLINRRSARVYREEMKKLLTVDSLRKLLKDPQSDDQAVVEAWKYLQSLGGHETGDALQQEVDERVNRQTKLGKFEELLRNAPNPANAKYDRKLVAAWNPQLAAGGQQYAQLQSQYHAAQARLQRFSRLSELSKQCTLAGEQEIALTARELPGEYHPKLATRVKMAQERLAAFRKLKEAYSRQPISDLAIASAWKLVQKTQGETLAPAKLKSLVDLANQRVPLIKQLRQLHDSLAAGEYDEKILAIWNDSLLTGCHDALPWWPRYNQARERKVLLDQVMAAIEAGDRATVDAIMARPQLRGYVVGESLRTKLQGLDEQVRQETEARRQGLFNSLVDNQRSQFAELFDADLLREICEKAPHHMTRISQWTESEILPLSGSGLAKGENGGLEKVQVEAPPPPPSPAGGDPAATPPENLPAVATPPRMRARWQWPPRRISGECLLMVLPHKPKPQANPDELEARYGVSLSRDAYERDSQAHEFQVEESWHDSYVYIWARVDVGFQQLYTEPLELGQLKLKKAASSYWGLFG